MTREQIVSSLAVYMLDEDTVLLEAISDNESTTSSATWMANMWADKATAQEIVASLTDDNPWKRYWQKWINEGLFN